jgi:hypothetical protein
VCIVREGASSSLVHRGGTGARDIMIGGVTQIV